MGRQGVRLTLGNTLYRGHDRGNRGWSRRRGPVRVTIGMCVRRGRSSSNQCAHRDVVDGRARVGRGDDTHLRDDGRSALTGCCCPMEMRDPSAWQPKEGVRRGIVTSKGVHTSGTQRTGPGRPPLLSAGSCGECRRRVDWGGNARVTGQWSKPHTSKW
jgi:hypothetical protein